MKTIEQLYEEIQNNETLKQEFITSFKEGGVKDFLKNHECDATAEDVMKYINSLKDGAISDDNLDKVAGGGCTSMTCNQTCTCMSLDFYC